jgi:D-alanyl-D-alanine carboxypeptidase/D-alanyl-D-alanine-endopeptidase (penicillin-binding protein 4)
LTEDSLQAYAVALAKAGVRRVQGAVRIDSTRFDAPSFGPGWDWDDLQEAYGSAAGALQFTGNAVAVIAEAGARVADPGRVRTSPLDGVFDVDAAVQTVASNQPARLSLQRLPGSRRLRVRGQLPAGKTSVERMSVPDADIWFTRGLQRAFQGAGIAVDRGFTTGGSIPAGTRRLAIVPSSPLSDLATWCLKRSNNQIAQMLWLQVGADVRLAPRSGETRDGADDNERASMAIGRFVARMGIAPGEVAMEEGSGLSRKDLLTPRATVQLLRRMATGGESSVWMAALPIGGVDGTLKGRFTQDSIRGRVIAKTGSMSHVNSLAGYITTLRGEPLAFALFVNGYVPADETASSRAEIDRWVSALAGIAP